jgi:hypothetical protein
MTISKSLNSSFHIVEVLRFRVEDLSDYSRSQEILELREHIFQVRNRDGVSRCVENDVHGTRHRNKCGGLRPHTIQPYEMPNSRVRLIIRLVFNEHCLRRIQGCG